MDQLTRDALAAEAAGLSYGKYMGRKYENEIRVKTTSEKTKRARLASQRCVVCAMLIPASSRSSRYCSPACAEKAQTEAPILPPLDSGVLKCGICGKEIANKRKKYCCPECANEARHLQIAAYKMKVKNSGNK